MPPVRTFTHTRPSRGSDFEISYASPVIIQAKGADEESLRRHASKRGLPRALNDEAGTLKDGRNRRSRGSSDDEGKITPDGLHNEDLRVGGPYLCSFPREHFNVPAGDSFNSSLGRQLSSGKTLWTEIDLLLEKHSVMNPIMNFRYQRSVLDPEPERVPTLSILSARQNLNDNWLSCVREIRSLLRREGLAALNVEIMDDRALRPSGTFPILQKDPIHGSWHEVLNSLLTRMDLSDVCGVGCYRRGSSTNIIESVPTVLIIVDVLSQRNWRDARDFVVAVLDEFDLPMVAVEIVKDRPMQMMSRLPVFSETGFVESLLDGKARAAGPLSNELDDSRSGTLGGFVSFREDISKPLRTYALTCFHCVDPADEDLEHLDANQINILKEWREDGISSGKTTDSFTLRVTHPSSQAIKEQIGSHADSIDIYEKTKAYQVGLEYKKQGIFDEALSNPAKQNWQDMHDMITESQNSITKIREFQKGSCHFLGEVALASGYRLKDLHTKKGRHCPTNLDWALISIPQGRPVSNQVGDDKFPTNAASPELFSEIDNEVTVEDESEETELKRVHLRGYCTGMSIGYYSPLQFARFTKKLVEGNFERITTLEYTVCPPRDSYFCQSGDSGALITFHRKGPVVGMLVGGFLSLGVGYFTRIDDLFEDIMSQVPTEEIKFVKY